MKNATAAAKKLQALLKKITKTDADEPLPPMEPLREMILSFLMWESTTVKADAAWQKLDEQVVDFNDLRVCMAREIVEMIGERYPLAQERAQRLRAVLRDVFLREHAMSLAGLEASGKREVRRYVESLDGMVPYVAARLLLLCFDTHTMPVDERLRDALAANGVIDEDADVDDVASWLTRQVKATDGVATYHTLQAWADEVAVKPKKKVTKKAPAGKKAPAKKAATKKTTTKKAATKKKTARKTATSRASTAKTSRKKTASKSR